MAKALKTEYECSDCGARSPKWLGRCTACNAWSTLVEVRSTPAAARVRASTAGALGGVPAGARQPVALTAVRSQQLPRIPTGIAEFDRVLGGGLVPGAVVLIGGDPGIGKSTLLMQALLSMAQVGRRVLYVTGEESASQVALRAERLGASGEVMLLASNELADVESALAAPRSGPGTPSPSPSPSQSLPAYDAVVVDSVQTIRAGELESAPGSVAQLREVVSRLTDQAKQRNIATFLIGHVTKDGSLAGPKVVEHLVDVVLAFEGDSTHAYRLVRGQKNRFGATSEVGVFEMLSEGLREVPEPSSLFISERAEGVAGSVVVPTAEGSRPMLVEVQALVAPAQYGAPRRVATGLDSNRLAVLLAVLARKADVPVLDQDVFAGVAGGARVDEPAVDLAVCAAIVSAFRERAIDPQLTCFGEVGLTGELRAVPRPAARLAEARKLGFKRVLLPKASAERLTRAECKGLELITASRLDQALDALF